MQQTNPQEGKTKEIQIVAGLKVVETEYRVKTAVFEEVPVKVPVFKDIEVKVPVFVDEQVKIPVGWDEVVNSITLSIAEKVFSKIETILHERLDKAIDERVKEIKYPRLVEELSVTKVPITVEVPVYQDREIINPVLKDVEVTNAILIDKPVLNAVVTDIRVTNAIIKDIEVERAVVREKVIEVIHKQCLDVNGKVLK